MGSDATYVRACKQLLSEAFLEVQIYQIDGPRQTSHELPIDGEELLRRNTSNGNVQV